MIVIVVVMIMMIVSMIVMVVVVEVVCMFVIICTGPFELVCSCRLLLATTLGFRAAAVVSVVFPGTYEVDRPVARLIFVTMMSPVSSVFGRNVQIKRRHSDRRGGRLDDRRLCVDNRRRTTGS